MIRALVVGVVILAVVLIGVAGLHRMGDRSRMLACQANLRDLQLALAMYAQDNDGFFPLRPPPGGNYTGSRWKAWPMRFVFRDGYKDIPEVAGPIEPYVKNVSIYACPSDPALWGDGGSEGVVGVYTWNLDLSGKRYDDVANEPLLWCRGPWHRMRLRGPFGRNVILVKGAAAYWLPEDEFEAMRKSK